MCQFGAGRTDIEQAEGSGLGRASGGGSVRALPIGHYALAMRRHSWAHIRQAFAQSWQCCAACFSHSVPHASQIIAHTRQISRAKRARLAMNEAANRQMAAHSRSSRMQSRIMATLLSCRHAVAQLSHASAHWLHASMQLVGGVWVMPASLHDAFRAHVGGWARRPSALDAAPQVPCRRQPIALHYRMHSVASACRALSSNGFSRVP